MNLIFPGRYEFNYYRTGEHTGTHFDAPAHFTKDAYRAHEISMEKLIGPGDIINVKVSFT